MTGKAWSIDWVFGQEAVCYNCKTKAVQRVEMLPVKTTVTCGHCGATRVYNIHGTYVATPVDTREVRAHRYDTWRFARDAVCPNHGAIARHVVTVDEYKAAILCPVCHFLHLYEIALYDRVKPR